MPTKEMFLERCQNLIRVLEEVRNEGRLFNLGVWMTTDPAEHLYNIPEGTCGTAACAIGWAAQDPWFIRRGLTLHLTSAGSDNMYEPILLRGKHCGNTHWSAVRIFFNMSSHEAHEIFSVGSYPEDVTINDVIQRVQQYITEEFHAPRS